MASDPTKDFQALLNRHGYGFCYAVIQHIGSNPLGWQFEVAEFPVDVQGKGTRIDFILRHRASNAFVVAECKRANPATANWCFAKAPRSSLRSQDELKFAVLERIARSDPSHPFRRVVDTRYTERLYHVAKEIRTGKKGESGGKNTDEIEGAVTQVLRGMNGLAEWTARNPGVLGDLSDREVADFLPVIFATANLHTTDVDFSTTELETGNVDLSQHALQPADWLHYQYYQSPGLLNTLESGGERASELAKALQAEYARTITIVSPSGIDDFLGRTSQMLGSFRPFGWEE